MWLKMFMYLIYTVIFLCSIHLIFNYNRKARLLRAIPGFKIKFIVGNALELFHSRADLLEFVRKSARKYKDLYRFWAFPIGVVCIYNPDDVEKILLNTKHSEKALVYNILEPWLREGLLMSRGSKWQMRRKILTPSFHFQILKQFMEIFVESTGRLMKDLETQVGQEVDVESLVSEFTLNSICETAMGTKLSDETSTSSAAFAYKKALHDLGIRFTERLSNVYYHFNFIFSFSKIAKEQKKNLDIVHSFTKSIISKRKQYIEKYGSNFNEDNVGDNDDDDVYFKSKKKPAMLDLLLSAQNKGLIDNDGIQEEVDTFVFEGHDTTAAALLFSLLCLANDKEIQTRIFTELDEIFGDSTRPPTMNDLSKMHYLDCCILETLRLYPPVHFIGRKLGESVTLSNYYVEKGTNVLIFIIDMHRREDLFKDALKYNPDRFLPENSAGRHPFAFIPFSAGLRNCIGQKFGMMEMKTCLSAILRRYRLEPVTRHEDVKFIPDLVLRAKPIYVKFFKRDK